MIIKEVSARKIKDSRSEWTIEVSINKQKASSPSGKSKGMHETPSFNSSLDWNIKAINSLQEIKNLEISSFSDLKAIESLIKRKFTLSSPQQFGANALFALESAILKALAKDQKKQLWQVINTNASRIPIPLGNAVGGGLHSHNNNRPTFQEFLLIPQKSSLKENVTLMNSMHRKLKPLLKSNKKNDEGAWQTSLSDEEILSILSKFKEIKVGLDIAASSFYNGEYHYNKKSLDRKSQIKYIKDLIEKYRLFYIEDPLHEEDFSGFAFINKSKSLTCGDDLTATQFSRLKKAVRLKSINCMIIKPNQNGSLLEVKKIVDFCKKNKIKTVLSHRSGETLDSAIADYAFAFQTDFVKFGIATKWREIKLKRLIEIEESL